MAQQNRLDIDRHHHHHHHHRDDNHVDDVQSDIWTNDKIKLKRLPKEKKKKSENTHNTKLSAATYQNNTHHSFCCEIRSFEKGEKKKKTDSQRKRVWCATMNAATTKYKMRTE